MAPTPTPSSLRAIVLVAFLIGGTLGGIVGRWSASWESPIPPPAGGSVFTAPGPGAVSGPMTPTDRPRGPASTTRGETVANEASLPGSPPPSDSDEPVTAGSPPAPRDETKPFDLARDGSVVALPPEALKHFPTLIAELEKACAEGSDRKAEYLGGLLYDLIQQEPTLAPEYVAAYRKASQPDVLEWLAEALGDGLDEASTDWEDSDPRHATLAAMRKLVTDAMLDVLLRDPSVERRVATMEPLREAGQDEVNPTLRTVAQSADSAEVRAVAVRNLGRSADQPESLSIILELIRRDPDAEVRQQAVRAVGWSMGAGGTTHALVEAFQRDSDDEVRLAAADIIASQGSVHKTVGLPALSRTLAEQGDASFRRRLLESVVRLAGKDVPQTLGGMTQDPQIGADVSDYLAILAEGGGDWRQIRRAKRERERARERQAQEQAPK